MTELQHRKIAVSRVRDGELQGDKVIFIKNMAGFAVIDGNERVGGDHIEKIQEITADEGVLQTEIAGETVEFNRVTTGGLGMRSAHLHLPNGTTRAVSLGDHVESIHITDTDE